MIEMKGVCKQFGNIRALDGLDIHVAKGSIYGLIGTNGAGKTTAIRHLTGMLRPDQGEVLLDGQPVWENPGAKQRVGVIPDEIFFPHGYTMKDMAKWYGRTYVSWDEERFQKVTETFGLDVKRRIRTFSKGMKKQAAFSLVMATRPDFLFLDEPIDGLDPIVRKQVWKVIVEDVAERETTVLVSSHNLKEMEGICDSIGILSRGRCVLEKDLDDLRGRMHKVQVAFPGGKWPEELERKFAGCAGARLPEAEERASAPMAGVTPTTGMAPVAGKAAPEPAMATTAGKAAPEPDMAPAAAGLEILHREHRGSVDMLILRGDPEEIRETFVAAEPLLFDVLPLSLEEIFIYEIGGDDHDISELII